MRAILKHRLVDEYVFWLEVAMNKVLIVKLEETFDDASSDRTRYLFVKHDRQ